MISADLHLHTCYSHGSNTPFEMAVAASRAGLALAGFTEHSPRPAGYNYTREYREQLTRFLPRYVKEILELKAAAKSNGKCKILLGLEMDWLDGQESFISQSIHAYAYDYIIGSVHFLDHWGFDDGSGPWMDASQEQCEVWYEEYFRTWKNMLASGFFQIAAHPDLIKIFSRDQFHIWLNKRDSRELIRACLVTLRGHGMAMEVSSAGLRKVCKEIYPARPIMQMARELDIPISFASDAHCMNDVARDFNILADYAKEFGYTSHWIYDNGKKYELQF